MENGKHDNTNYELADIIMGKPHEFRVGRKLFRIYPVTLAKTLLQKRYTDAMEIDYGLMKTNPVLEALRLVKEHKEECCSVLSIHSAPNTYKDFINRKSFIERRNVLMTVQREDLASMLITVLSSDKTGIVMRELGIEAENSRMQAVMAVKKKSKNNIDFGALTIFGRFIAPLKELGYSDEEILYERGYSFLRLMLADKANSLYLTDDELAELPALKTVDASMDANKPENADKIMASLENRRGLKIK